MEFYSKGQKYAHKFTYQSTEDAIKNGIGSSVSEYNKQVAFLVIFKDEGANDRPLKKPKALNKLCSVFHALKQFIGQTKWLYC